MLATDSLRAILDIDDFSKELKISEIQWGKRIGRGSFGEVYSVSYSYNSSKSSMLMLFIGYLARH